MDQAKEKSVGRYQDKLDPVPTALYLEKIKKIGGVDLYEYRNWTQNLKDLPPLSEAELVLYLFNGISYYTSSEFRNAKSLRALGQSKISYVWPIINNIDSNCAHVLIYERKNPDILLVKVTTSDSPAFRK
ncbi:hypothetical protein ABVT39_022471 [Epinephelus coioides]